MSTIFKQEVVYFNDKELSAIIGEAAMTELILQGRKPTEEFEDEILVGVTVTEDEAGAVAIFVKKT